MQLCHGKENAPKLEHFHFQKPTTESETNKTWPQLLTETNKQNITPSATNCKLWHKMKDCVFPTSNRYLLQLSGAVRSFGATFSCSVRLAVCIIEVLSNPVPTVQWSNPVPTVQGSNSNRGRCTNKTMHSQPIDCHVVDLMLKYKN